MPALQPETGTHPAQPPRKTQDYFGVSDAATSRVMGSEQACLARLSVSNAAIATTETVLFEWLEQTGTAAFTATDTAHIVNVLPFAPM